jgi:hypothetical protein
LLYQEANAAVRSLLEGPDPSGQALRQRQHLGMLKISF